MKEYTVCFLFTQDLGQVLLVRKKRTEFTGQLNGVGGELEPGEQPLECALREIREETGITPGTMAALSGGMPLAHLGTLQLPHDCKYGTNDGCTLHYFAGIMLPGTSIHGPVGGEMLEARPSREAAASGTGSREYAGNGDLGYFVAAALKALDPYKQTDARTDADPLAHMLSVHRGYMDAAFREGDLLRASEEAGTVSRLAYAAWHGSQK